MKKIAIVLFTFIILCSVSKLQAQENVLLDSMINKSLVTYINKYKEDIEKGSINEDLKNLCIVIDNYPRNFVFCQAIQDMNLKYISLVNFQCQKELRKKENYRAIFLGINLTSHRLSIAFSTKILTIHKKNNLHIGISDWGDFIYEYSCEKQEWILVEVKYGGV